MSADVKQWWQCNRCPKYPTWYIYTNVCFVIYVYLYFLWYISKFKWQKKNKQQQQQPQWASTVFRWVSVPYSSTWYHTGNRGFSVLSVNTLRKVGNRTLCHTFISIFLSEKQLFMAIRWISHSEMSLKTFAVVVFFGNSTLLEYITYTLCMPILCPRNSFIYSHKKEKPLRTMKLCVSFSNYLQVQRWKRFMFVNIQIGLLTIDRSHIRGYVLWLSLNNTSSGSILIRMARRKGASSKSSNLVFCFTLTSIASSSTWHLICSHSVYTILFSVWSDWIEKLVKRIVLT